MNDATTELTPAPPAPARRLVQSLLEQGAARTPDRPALVAGGRRLTYRALDQVANGLAWTLKEHGVCRGDRVVILLPNDVEAVASIFGVLKAGATFVVLHPSTKPDRLAQILEDAGPAALVTDGPRLRVAGPALSRGSSVRALLLAGATQGQTPEEVVTIPWGEIPTSPEAPPCESIELDLATLIYTSGTTGRAKGVMSTHANVLAATTSINAYLGNTPGDVILDVLPLAFDYGLFQIFLAFQAGARIVLEPGFTFPAQVVARVAEEGVTGLPCVPTIVATLLRQPRLLAPLRGLRYITNTGAALMPAHIAELRRALPAVRIVSMYGLTECKRVSYLPPEQVDLRPDSVGVPIPGTEVWVEDGEGRRLPPGEVGELVVRGPHVTRGYWRAPSLSAQRFRPGPLPGEMVLHTGDLFRRDAEGYLYFVGRTDDIIKTRGEKVSPREVEGVVCRLPGVAEAAVIGVPDEVLGEAVVLVVTLREGARLTERDLRAHCAAGLDAFMQPARVVIQSDLPRTDNGKVDKRRLRIEMQAPVEVH